MRWVWLLALLVACHGAPEVADRGPAAQGVCAHYAQKRLGVVMPIARSATRTGNNWTVTAVVGVQILDCTVRYTGSETWSLERIGWR